MEEEYTIDRLLGDLYGTITGKRVVIANAPIKLHGKHLERYGDLSYETNPEIWRQHSKAINDVVINEDELIAKSENWVMPVSNCEIINNHLHLCFKRTELFNAVMVQIMKRRYGSFPMKTQTVSLRTRALNEDMDLSELRLSLACTVAVRILEEIGYKIVNSENADFNILISDKSENVDGFMRLLCREVILVDPKNNYRAAALLKKQATEMRLIAEHRYGLRTTPEKDKFFTQLGKTAVTINMLSVGFNKPVKILGDGQMTSIGKGAAFILYNCGRISSILDDFRKKVDDDVYPPLPDVQNLEFALLNQPEEWEILYVYLLRYPQLCRHIAEKLLEGKSYIHSLCSFLDDMCKVFSSYYKRIRVLLEPRKHLHSLIHARIYFLKCIQTVMHSSLTLLNIQPITHM